jgi:dimethylargininase
MLASCGATVVTTDVNLAYPDCVFVEDTAVVLDEVAVLASMGAEARRGEPAGMEPLLRRYREVIRVNLPARLDGGDVVVAGRSALVGLSSRTDAAGVDAIRDILAPLGYTVRAVRIDGCLHLKSACTVLPDGGLFVNRAWANERDLNGFRLLDIPAGEQFAADVLTIGPTVVVSRSFPQAGELLTGRGFDVRAVDLSEFAKAEGGVTCLSLVFSE